MAKTPQFTVEWRAGKAGMRSDIDPRNMQNGGLFVDGVNTGGYNVRAVGKGMNVSPDYEPITGYTYVSEIAAATAQNKIFQINVDVSGTTINSTFGFQLYTPSGLQLFDYFEIITVDTIANTLDQMQTDLEAYFTDLTPVVTQTITGTDTGYLTLEFTTPPYWDYQIAAFQVFSGPINITYEVIQEAIDPGMIDQDWRYIGSTDQTGVCYTFATNKAAFNTTAATITNAQDDGTGLIQITTASAHGLLQDQAVKIQGVEGTVEANGVWIVDIVDATNFILQYSSFVNAYTGGGVVITNIAGLGEIGVVQKDAQNTYTYTRLLRSREFNFSTQYQIDCKSKYKQDSSTAVYFTDNYNVPRVFYYFGDFITDGALITNPPNIYQYGILATQLKLIPSTEGFNGYWTNQIQSGGALYSGNWRYAFRFSGSTIAFTNWTQLTNPVPVYSYNNQSGPFILGDEENLVTPKINVLIVNNPTPGLFKYVEVAAVNYVGTAVQGWIIGRYTLNGDPTQTIQHTGNEANIQDLDLGTLAAVDPLFEAAQNLELLDTRLILSNLTPAQFNDFSSWVDTFRYSLELDDTIPVGEYTTSNSTLFYGEYQQPENVYTKMSHMIYEQYRYGVQFRMKKTGLLSPVFFFTDISIKLGLTNPKEDAGTFLSYDITDDPPGGNPSAVYTVYVDLHDIDLDYLIDGVPARELISEIIPMRAPVIPEVLAFGVGVMGVDDTLTDGPAKMFYGGNPAVPIKGPFPFYMGTGLFSLGYTNIASSDNPTYPDLWTAADQSVFFYAPDILWNHTAIDFRDGDQLVNFGCAHRHDRYEVAGSSPGAWPSNYAEFNGFIGNNPEQLVLVEDAVKSSKGIQDIPIGADTYSLQLVWDSNYAGINDNNRYLCESALCIKTTTALTNGSANLDYGIYQMLYYRELTNKYGDAALTRYETTGVIYSVGNATGVIGPGEIKIYGDCCVQKSYLKQRYPGYNGYEMGGGVGYYTMNRINSQMRRKPTPTYTPNLVPQLGINNWLQDYYGATFTDYANFIDPQFNYNEGYTPRNSIQSYLGYDSTISYQKDWGNALAWSNPEVDGSSSDNNRIFAANNIKFLDFSLGAITESKALNNELITVQPRGIYRQYFNSTNIISTTSGAEVVLGDAAVLNRKGTSITQLGSQHKWSIVIGKSDKGDQVMYGIDAINKTVWRIGYDGVNSLDEIDGMKSFFANALDWVDGKYTPVYSEGISSVANQRFREVLFTVRCRKSVEVWQDDVTYTTGDVRSYGDTTTFEQFRDYYIALQDNVGKQPDVSPDDWQLISHDNLDYFNEYTVAYSEIKNEFQAFHSPKPKIYLKFLDGFLAPRPVSNEGELYVANQSPFLEWFNNGQTVQTANGFFDGVVNVPDGRKRFLVVRVQSDATPARMELRTPTGYTYMDGGDFERREGNEFDCAIRNDATITTNNPGGANNIDTSVMYGQWGIFRWFINNLYYNKYNSFRVKCYMRERTNNE